MIWLTNFYDFRFKWTATAAIGIYTTKAWLSLLVNFTMQSGRGDTLEKRYAIKFCFKLVLDHLAWIEHQFLSGIRDSRKAGSLWGMVRGVRRVRKSIDQSWLAKGLRLGLLCWGFKGVQEEIPSEEASILQIGSVAFPRGQCTSPQRSLSQTIWPKWASRQFLTVPIVQTLLLVAFAYSVSSEAVAMRQLRRWKRLWRRSLTRSHKRTSMGPSRSC